MTARIAGATAPFGGLIADRLWLALAVSVVHVFERTHRPTINNNTTE